MYPLKAVLVGFDENELSDVRHELDEQGASVEALYPDVKSTVEGLYPPHEEKRLFIYRVGTTDDFRQMQRLNDAFVGRPILAMLRGDDPGRMVQAMRAGAAQVVTLPLQADDLRTALERIARQFGYPHSESKVIAVSGVSEGCGATSVAVNLAAEIAQTYQLPCILAELSLRLGRLAGFLDLEPHTTTHDLLADAERLDIDAVRHALTPMGEHLQVLVGPYKGIARGPVSAQHVIRLVDYLRRLAPVVVLDMPSTFDEVYFKAIVIADRVVLTGQQTVASVQALKTVYNTLLKTEGIGSIYPLINRYDRHVPEITTSYLQELLQVPKIYTVANDWQAFSKATNEGRTLRQLKPRPHALNDIDGLVEELLGIPGKAQARWHLPGLWRRLVSSSAK
jgi:Flp pilus assembly CpaE family ATPase